MYPLYLYYQSTNQVALNLESDPLIQGCRYAPATGAGDAPAEDVIELALAGSWPAISQRIRQIEALFFIATSQLLRKAWVYLRFWDGASYDWRSRVLSGRVELAARGLADRDGETQLVKLHVTRQNFWAGPKTKATGFTKWEQEPYGRYPVDGIASCTDADHDNGFGICGHAIEGSLPGPVEIWIENNFSSDPYNDFTISQRIIPGVNRSDTGFVEGEDLAAGVDATKNTISDPFCSAGAYASFAWSGATEKSLAVWSPGSPELDIMAGAPHRAILRLRDALAYSDLWACVRVMIGGTSTLLAESLWSLLPAGSKYIELAPVNLPPILEGAASYQGVDVALWVWRAGGDGALAIDFVQFTPAERIRRLKALYQGMIVGHGKYLVDSGIDEETYYLDASGSKQTTHIGSGQYLEVIPGCDSMIRVLHTAGGAADFGPFVQYDFHLWYEPRRRTL